jgi:hypothetical protein
MTHKTAQAMPQRKNYKTPHTVKNQRDPPK